MTNGGRPGRRPAWFDLPDEPESGAASRVAQQLRSINALVVDGRANEDALETLAGTLSELYASLAAPGVMEQQPPPAGPIRRSLRSTSPVAGAANAAAPPVRIWLDGDSVRGLAMFDATFEGPPGHVHGGIIAAAFDEVLGATQALTEQTGMTGTLTVRYRRPTPLHREVEFHGRLERVSGRKILASATLHDGEMLCAEAEAIFVAVDFAALEARGRSASSM